MSPNLQPDSDLERTLRRVAGHLAHRGAQYRERPVVETSMQMASTQRRGRAGLWAVAVTLVCAVVGGTMLAQSASPSAERQRLEAGTEVVSSTTEAAVDTTVRDALAPSDPSSPGDPSDPDGTVADDVDGGTPVTIVPALPPDITAPDTSFDIGWETGPVILDIAVPSVVSAGSSITFTWRVTDPDEVSATGVVIGWVNGIYTPCGFGDVGSLSSGTLLDGEWSYTCTFPSTAVATTYSVDVWATDSLGNSSRSDWYEFRVEGGNSDSSAPTYTNVRVVSGASVGDVLTVTWSVADPSGIDYAVMWIAGPTGGFTNLDTSRSYAMYDTMVVTKDCNAAGDSCDVTQTVRIDPTSPPGSYALWVSTADTLGNKILTEVLRFTVVV